MDNLKVGNVVYIEGRNYNNVDEEFKKLHLAACRYGHRVRYIIENINYENSKCVISAYKGDYNIDYSGEIDVDYLKLLE